MNLEAEQIGMAILQSIADLKAKYKNPIHCLQRREFYLIDDKYDVRVTTEIIEKKSQESRVLEMFEGSSS